MEKITIIGSGPAGLTAAIYAARAELAPLVLAGTMPGGQLTQTTEIENYPGFAEGVQGFDLMVTFRQQAERFGARVENCAVTSVEFNPGRAHVLVCDDGTRVETRAVIIANGARPRWLGLPSEEALKNKGVSSCATCDGAFFRDVPIAVVGGGDSAMEEAQFLTHFGSKVYVIHRREQLRASQIMQERTLSNPKIEVVWNAVVEEILDIAKDEVTGIRIKDVVSGKTRVIDCGAVFVAIGHIPNTEPFEGKLDMEGGYILLKDPARTFTSVEGVFVAGDCADQMYRQAITAAGMGCKAAMDAERWLATLE